MGGAGVPECKAPGGPEQESLSATYKGVALSEAVGSQASLAIWWKPSPPSWSLNGYSRISFGPPYQLIGREDRRRRADQVHQPDREERRRAAQRPRIATSK